MNKIIILKFSLLIIILSLINIGCDITQTDTVNPSLDSAYNSILNYKLLEAVESNADIDEIKNLIMQGADVNTTDGYVSVLMYATAFGNREVVNILIDHGANINYIDPYQGYTALAYALGNKHNEIVKILVENDADINNVDQLNGYSALYYAICLEDVELIKYLISKGADLNIENKYGQSPFFSALIELQNNERYYEIIELFLINDAAINCDDEIILWVANNCTVELLKMFIDYGANINIIYDDCIILLKYCINPKNIELLNILITKDININYKNSNNETILDYVIKDCPDTEIIEILLEAGAKQGKDL